MRRDPAPLAFIGGDAEVLKRAVLEPVGAESVRVIQREVERIFRGPTWNFLCLEAELPKPNTYRTSAVGAMPVVVTRDNAGRLNAFENRCAHRGSLLCINERGEARAGHLGQMTTPLSGNRLEPGVPWAHGSHLHPGQLQRGQLVSGDPRPSGEGLDELKANLRLVGRSGEGVDVQAQLLCELGSDGLLLLADPIDDRLDQIGEPLLFFGIHPQDVYQPEA